MFSSVLTYTLPVKKITSFQVDMFKGLPTILQIYMITVEVVSGSVNLSWIHSNGVIGTG